MLSARAKRLLTEALELPEKERIEFVEELVQAAPLSAEWLNELDVRAAEIDSGAVDLVPGDEAHAQIRAEIGALSRR